MKILIWGYQGKMGNYVRDFASKMSDVEIVGGADLKEDPSKNVYSDYRKLPKDADVIIDFSRAASIDDILSYALSNQTAVVLATTAYSDTQLEAIHQAAKQIPILLSGNMSLGVNLITTIVEELANKLGSAYDIEIIEAHHNKKVDSPSGTAKMLLASAEKGRGDITKEVYGRHADNDPREVSEIGVHAVRGGTIVGEHTVLFAGPDEMIEIKHTALSRAIFATGALKAARYLTDAKAGMYSMKEVLL